MFFELAHGWSQTQQPGALPAWDLGVFVSPADGLAELVAKRQRSAGGGFAQQLGVVFGVGMPVAGPFVGPAGKTDAASAVESLVEMLAEGFVAGLAGDLAEPFVSASESEACWDGSGKYSTKQSPRQPVSRAMP